MIKLDVAHYLTLILGITLSEVETVLSIICLLLSIGFGIFGIVLKYKKYIADGKLDKKEIEDLLKDVNELKDKIDKK